MKITKQRLIEIIKEEYQKILNENRVRMDSMDINFQGRDQAQLLGMKGRLAISRQDAKAIMYAIQKEFSIRA
jgi:aspartyl aminopeptidase